MAAAAPIRKREPKSGALPMEEQIRRRAHEIYLDRGAEPARGALFIAPTKRSERGGHSRRGESHIIAV